MGRVNYFYPRWGAEHIDWVVFLDRVKNEGYKGIEWFPFGEISLVDYDRVFGLLEERGLQYCIVMAVKDSYETFEDYLLLLEKQLFMLSDLVRLKPLFISAQVGREYFTIDQISRCIHLCNQVEKQTGVSIFQETHRNKWSYGIHRLEPIIELFPDLKLTLDISHWFCVSESFLEDQQFLLSKILHHVHHVHCRVGHTQGSQVHDVSHIMYEDIVQKHTKVWQQYLDNKLSKEESYLTFTTEFGPPPYLISCGDKDLDYQEQWRQNVWIKHYLENNLKYKL